MPKTFPNLFRIDRRVAVITGGAGMLGMKHAEAIAEAGGIPVLVDINESRIDSGVEILNSRFGNGFKGYTLDITDRDSVNQTFDNIVRDHGRIDILINNAAMTVESNIGDHGYFAPFEEYDVSIWEMALRVSLTGAFNCTQAVGRQMKDQNHGVVLNIASDVGVISPDHRIYQPEGDYAGTPFNTPVSYAVSKAGLISFTRYMATYWAPINIRVNALSPAGVYTNQEEQFVRRLENLIPLGRMASQDEYKGAILFLVSDASAFMTGFNVVMDGGRTAW